MKFRHWLALSNPAEPSAALIELIWKLLRIKGNPPLTKFDLAFVNMPRSYRVDKAVTQLKYKPIKNRDAGFKELSSLD